LTDWTEFRKKYSNIKFNETPSNSYSTLADGQTDMTKLIVIFRKFAKVPKNREIGLSVISLVKFSLVICLVKFKLQDVP